MIGAWFAVAAAAAAFIGAVVFLASLRPRSVSTPGGRCAACGGEPDRTTLACRDCGGDVRVLGLTAPNLQLLSRRQRLLLSAAVLVPIVVGTMASALFGPRPGIAVMLKEPVVAQALGPRSGAYTGVRITVREQMHFPGETANLPAFAIIRLLDDRQLPTATLLAVRGDGTWRAGNEAGPALEPTQVARWISDATGADADLAGIEAADLLDLLRGAEGPGPTQPDRLGELASELDEAYARLRERRLRGSERREEMDRIQRRIMSGVRLEAFADWTIPISRGGGGSGINTTRARHALQAAVAAWLLVAAAIVACATLLDRRRRPAAPHAGSMPAGE